MKILQVLASLHIGGQERVAADLSAEFTARGHSVTTVVIKAKGVIGEEMSGAGLDVRLISEPGDRWLRHTSFWRIRNIVRNQKFDIVLSHGTAAMVENSLSKIFGANGIHVHTFHFGNYPHRSPRERLLEKFVWRVPDQLVAVGSAQKDAICSTYHISPERVVVIPNGVKKPSELRQTDELFSISETDVPILGTVATLIPQKGLEILIDAARLLRDDGLVFRLFIAGDGPLKNDLQEKIDSLGLHDVVSLLGWVESASDKLIPKLDVFVQSSHWEAMSIVILEAMANGVPIVATDVGDNSKVLTDGVSGYITPPGNAAILADRITRILKNNDLANSLSAAAKSDYDANYTIQAMADRYESLFGQLRRA